MPDFSKMSDEELNTYIERASGKKSTSGLDYLFSAVDAARKSLQSSTLNPATLAFETALREAGNPANAQSAINALKMQPAAPGADIAGQALNMGIRHGPTIAASMALPGSMAAEPISEAVGGALGKGLLARGAAGAAGAVAGAAEQGAVAGGTNALQRAVAGQKAGEAIGGGIETGKSFAEGALAAPPILGGIKLGTKGISGAASWLTERAGGMVSGIRPESFQVLKEFGDKVMSYAKKGMTISPINNRPVPAALADAQAMAGKAQNLIAEHAAGAGKQFNAMLEALAEAPESAKRLNVAGEVYDKIEPYVDKFTRYRDAAKSATDDAAAKIFNHYYDRIKSTLAEGMAPKEAASLLGAMTEDQRVYRGSQLSAHLAKLKETLLDAFPEYSKSYAYLSGPSWNIAETRANYKAAKTLQRELQPFASKDNALSAIDSAQRAGGKVAAAINKFSAINPEFKQLLSEIPIAKAGADFAPVFSNNLPRTGLTGAAGLMAAKAAGGSMADIPGAALYGIGASPRAVGTVINSGRKLPGIIGRATNAAQPYAKTALQLALESRNGQ